MLRSHCWSAGLVFAAGLASGEGLAAGARSYVSLALTRTEEFSRGGDDKSKREVTILDVAAAYTSASGLGIGAKYYNFAVNSDSGQETGTVIAALGPMIGYLHGSGFFGTGTFLIEPTKTMEVNGDAVTFKDGNGYVIDVGKIFDFGAWGAALQVTHAKVTYEKVEGDAIQPANEKLEGDWNDASTYPLIGVFVFF